VAAVGVCAPECCGGAWLSIHCFPLLEEGFVMYMSYIPDRRKI